jgi:hypothetical protein
MATSILHGSTYSYDLGWFAARFLRFSSETKETLISLCILLIRVPRNYSLTVFFLERLIDYESCHLSLEKSLKGAKITIRIDCK